MRKLQSKKGFTLAELLIVVAIIAILVAIGIPAFSTAMERSRETVDLSNIRGAYAEFMAQTLGGSDNTGYFKIDFKQRKMSDWVIDTSGFTTNIETPSDIDSLPANTGTVYVKFTYKGVTGEKPKISMSNSAPSGMTGDVYYTTES